MDATGREGWWYEGGGIYRHVWLEYRDCIHIAPDGVYVAAKPLLAIGGMASAPAAAGADVRLQEAGTAAQSQEAGTAVQPGEAVAASVRIRTEVRSRKLEAEIVQVISTVEDVDGNAVAKTESSLTANPWEDTICEQEISMEQAMLWSLESPYLYKLRIKILVNRTETDSCVTSFGVRSIRFDADQGFFLNEKHVKIKGLCCHHDHAGVGIAVPDSVQEYRIAKMKEMGANAYRTAHYPPTRELLDICDRMGVLVFDETRRMSAAPQDLECIQAMVRRDRNHPCVFLWGIGNEEIFAQHRPEMARATVTMRMAVRKLDDTRPITSAVVCWDGKQRFDNAAMYVPVTKELDVMGFNYCQTAWDDYHERMPKQPIIITEASANSGTRGCYETDEARGMYYVMDPDNETKCKNGKKAVKRNNGENQWKACDERPYLAGIFLWTGIDYRGEPTPSAWPAVNSQFGILDSCGFRKDNFYYYRSWWTDEPNFTFSLTGMRR